MTTLLRPVGPAALHTLSLAAAVAVRRAAMALGARDVALKWPNDVWVGDRKLAGILLEADDLETAAPWVLVGIGVNVASVPASQLPQEVRQQAVGLCDVGVVCPHGDAVALDHMRIQAAHQTVAALHALTEAWSAHGLAAILDEWAGADVLATHPVRAELEGGWLEGIARGLDAEGQLQIDTALGLRCIQAGLVERVRPQKNGPVPTR